MREGPRARTLVRGRKPRRFSCKRVNRRLATLPRISTWPRSRPAACQVRKAVRKARLRQERPRRPTKAREHAPTSRASGRRFGKPFAVSRDQSSRRPDISVGLFQGPLSVTTLLSKSGALIRLMARSADPPSQGLAGGRVQRGPSAGANLSPSAATHARTSARTSLHAAATNARGTHQRSRGSANG